MKTPLLLIASAVAVSVLPRGAASAAPAPPVPPPTAAPSMGPPSEAPPLPPDPEPRPGGKSPLIATSLTFGVTLLGLAIGIPMADREPGLGSGTTIAVLSAVVGPSTGWFYAGRPWHGVATAAARAGGGVLLLWAIADSFEARPSRADEAGAWLGVGLILGATIVDLVGPPRAIGNDNRRARGGMALLPTAHPGGGGLALGGYW